jgi:hypothetical protein
MKVYLPICEVVFVVTDHCFSSSFLATPTLAVRPKFQHPRRRRIYEIWCSSNRRWDFTLECHILLHKPNLIHWTKYLLCPFSQLYIAHMDVGFSWRSLGLNPRLFYARFLVNVVAMEQIFLPKYIPLSPTTHHSIIAPYFSTTARLTSVIALTCLVTQEASWVLC